MPPPPLSPLMDLLGVGLELETYWFLHPATLAVVRQVPESVGEGFGDRQLGSGVDDGDHR
jgi:hypothetical protein